VYVVVFELRTAHYARLDTQTQTQSTKTQNTGALCSKQGALKKQGAPKKDMRRRDFYAAAFFLEIFGDFQV
jgi:hypothetical protein